MNNYRKIKLDYNTIYVNEDGTSIKVEANGEIRSAIPRIRKGKNRDSYRVYIYKKIYSVHKIVAQAWLDNPNNYKLVVHEDYNHLNNHYTNLKWTNKRGFKLNRIKHEGPDKNRYGSKITYEQAVDIGKRLDAGEYGSDIAKEFGVSEMSITRIRRKYSQKIGSIRYPKELKEEAKNMALTYTYKQIQEILNLEYMVLYRWMGPEHKQIYDERTRANWRIPKRQANRR